MSIGVSFEAPALQRLNRRVNAISRLFMLKANGELLETLGGIVESQTRRRISEEKSDPKGKPWRNWSEEYAGDKHGAANHDPHPNQLRESQGHSLLVLEGNLLDSIQFVVGDASVTWGSNLVYARYQNSMREFLGLSSANEKEIAEIVDDFLDEELNLLGFA